MARKLALRPSEISDFLLSNNIALEEGSNAKVQDEHVVLIMQKYAPSLLEETKRELIAERENEIMPAASTDVAPTPPVREEESSPVIIAHESIANPTVEVPAESSLEKNEVIKAPKIALSGLKVIGKIDLPEPKKKEPQQGDSETSETSTSTASTSTAPRNRKTENRKDNNQKRDRTYQQPRKNPIALQRERELEEIAQKKKIEAERRKEKRTRNYLKKIKSAPTKPMKLIDEQVEEMAEETSAPPKTWLGKFFRWLRS